LVKQWRYSVSIPRFYGDLDPKVKGQKIPDSSLQDTLEEIQQKVEGMTGVPSLRYAQSLPSETTPFEGIWKGIPDVGIIVYFDVPFERQQEMNRWLSGVKPKWKKRFGQLEMYIIGWEIDVIQ